MNDIVYLTMQKARHPHLAKLLLRHLFDRDLSTCRWGLNAFQWSRSNEQDLVNLSRSQQLGEDAGQCSSSGSGSGSSCSVEEHRARRRTGNEQQQHQGGDLTRSLPLLLQRRCISQSWWQQQQQHQQQQRRGAASAAAAAAADRDALIDERLHALAAEHEALQAQLHDGSVPPGSEQYTALARRAGALGPVADGAARLAKLAAELRGADELAAAPISDSGGGDGELRALAREEAAALRDEIAALRESLVGHLVPPDDDDARNAVVEVRAGVGGDWAASFAGDLLAMYRAYAASQGWQFELLSASYTDFGGIKAADALVTGHGAYGRLRHESGVHRAQAVPFTEKAGRVQTGTASVAVLAEAAEADVAIAEADLKWDTFRAGGAGGQHVNTTDSAVRVTHVPTGVVVACQSERSQHQNRAKALRLLRSKVQEAGRARAAAAASAARQQAHGSARFSERIRTFQYVDGRVTDHRVPGLSVMGGVERVLEGGAELDRIIGAVAAARREEALAELLSSSGSGGEAGTSGSGGGGGSSSRAKGNG